MKKVLCGADRYERLCLEGLELLKKNGFTVDFMTPGNKSELLSHIDEYCAVISGLEIWDEQLFDKAKNLKIIAKFGVGLDSIDLEAAKRHNVCITFAKGLNAASVANTTVMLMLAGLKRLALFDKTTKQGQWLRTDTYDLDGKTVGMIGFGQISQFVVNRLRGFNVNVIAYDAFADYKKAEEMGVQMMEMDEVLSKADVISVHVPLLPDTYHAINEDAFKKMKKTAVFVNTSRGKVVDERALYKALKEGWISAAAIDVFENEPTDPHNPLFDLPNFTCTPHVAADTMESAARVGYMAAKNITSFFNGEELELVVIPPQK